VISFYDTSTLPTQDMLDAIARAPLGDDVYGLDPTVNELEAVAAGLIGKQAAVLMPSGTMANLAAVLSWTHPADEVVVEAEAHLLYYEGAGSAGWRAASRSGCRGTGACCAPRRSNGSCAGRTCTTRGSGPGRAAVSRHGTLDRGPATRARDGSQHGS
jgi:hypothetical protein